MSISIDSTTDTGTTYLVTYTSATTTHSLRVVLDAQSDRITIDLLDRTTTPNRWQQQLQTRYNGPARSAGAFPATLVARFVEDAATLFTGEPSAP